MEILCSLSLSGQNLRVRQTARMSLRPVASLAVKLLGLYAMLQSLSSLALTWLPGLRIVNNQVLCSFTGCFPQWSDVVHTIMVGVTQLLMGAGLWWFAERVTRVLVRRNVPTFASEATWRFFGFGILGAFLLADSAAWLLEFRRSAFHVSQSFPTVLATVVRSSVGLWLLLHTGVVRGLLNFKNWGRDPDPV